MNMAFCGIAGVTVNLTEAGRSQEGICNGVQNSRCPGNIRKIYIGCPHPHKPEPGGMGHMEQGHSELFWVATALQLTPGMVVQHIYNL